MQISRQAKRIFMLKSLLGKQYFSTASPFLTQFNLNKLRNAVRFENQNRIWTFEELEKHSNAFAYGLVELGYKPGDTLLVWLDKQFNAEVVAAQFGAAKAGVKLFVCEANNEEELEKQISASSCTGILFSPNTKLGDSKYIDAINKVVPEAVKLSKGANLTSSKFSKLKHLIQTGFYSYPGTFKFKHILTYASKNFNSLQLPSFDSGRPFYTFGGQTFSFGDLQSKVGGVDAKSTVVVAGDPCYPASFSFGALNSALNGNYSVYTGNYDVNKLGKLIKLHQNVFLVFDSELKGDLTSSNWEEKVLKNVKKVTVTGEKVDLKDFFKGVSLA